MLQATNEILLPEHIICFTWDRQVWTFSLSTIREVKRNSTVLCVVAFAADTFCCNITASTHIIIIFWNGRLTVNVAAKPKDILLSFSSSNYGCWCKGYLAVILHNLLWMYVSLILHLYSTTRYGIYIFLHSLFHNERTLIHIYITYSFHIQNVRWNYLLDVLKPHG